MICEKCWHEAINESFGVAGRNGVEQYRERVKTAKCTPEEAAGPAATECPWCKRKTVHQYARACVICGHKKGNRK